MNKLSFVKEHMIYDAGWEKEEFTAFFYCIDGKKITFEGSKYEYRPVSKFEVLTNWKYPKHPMVILNRCGCGFWECDSWKAYVSEKGDFVEWEIHGIDIENRIYTFDKTEYIKVMSEIRQAALDECTIPCKVYSEDGDASVVDYESEVELNDEINERLQDDCLHITGYEKLKTGEKYKVEGTKVFPLN